MKVYLAGPDVFLRNAQEVGHRKKEICARHGLVGLFPLDHEIDDIPVTAGPADQEASLQIFRRCVAMMEAADAIIANLTPFRGPSADAGTVFELGFMAARGKLCTGYSNVPGSYIDRIDNQPRPRDGQQIHVDRDGNSVEDFGLADNLMIVHALGVFGQAILTPLQALADRWQDLTLFEKCVRWIADKRA
jgi:nucleoside 2-deoxyribosyltransferase